MIVSLYSRIQRIRDKSLRDLLVLMLASSIINTMFQPAIFSRLIFLIIPMLALLALDRKVVDAQGPGEKTKSMNVGS